MKSKLFKAKCSQCGKTFRRRTRGELLTALRKHLWSAHRAWMIARIKAGKRAAVVDNPSIQDLVQAIEKGSARAAQAVVSRFTERRYGQVKEIMDAISPLLPLKARIAWEAVEAGHDFYGKVRKIKGG